MLGVMLQLAERSRVPCLSFLQVGRQWQRMITTASAMGGSREPWRPPAVFEFLMGWCPVLPNYQSLTNFIRSYIVDPGLEVNHLDRTRSAILRITSGFENLGWTVEKVVQEGSRHSRHELTSPHGEIRLSMIGGKVFRHPQVTEEICRQKHLTKRMLDIAALPAPVGADFAHTEYGPAEAFFQKMKKPIVVKPADAGGSHGVTVGVNTSSEFSAAWEHALSEGRVRSKVLLEEFISGVEIRPYVIGNEVVSVVARIQPYVVGSGVALLTQLIDDLDDERSVNYRAKRLPVVVDWDFVAKQGYSGESIITEDKIVYLSPFCYPTIGAFIVDVTDVVSDDLKQMAVGAKNAIPGLEIAGIDILVEDLESAEKAHVVEVNTAAALDMHRYPTHGGSSEVADEIVGYFHQQYLKGGSS